MVYCVLDLPCVFADEPGTDAGHDVGHGILAKGGLCQPDDGLDGLRSRGYCRVYVVTLP
jgi:hypothetical protein